MKRLLLLLLAALVLPTDVKACILGNCGSEYEALQTCEKWAKKVKSETIEIYSYIQKYIHYGDGNYGSGYGYIPIERFSRICFKDNGSKKILGTEYDRKLKKENVKKRFKY